jgi:hypothetical protein
MDQKIRATDSSFRVEHGGDAANIVAPVTCASSAQGVEIEFDTLGEIFRRDYDSSVIPRRSGNVGVELNRGRHDETIVVVRVLANQIYATRRATNYRRRTIALAEGTIQRDGDLRGSTRGDHCR